ncbi:hypothetical protein GGR58DRAFT_525903 [Xylaria digitata]|nr:hypothetical protein GGR58DRAFT_525903 [Xylaria digitata]
MSDPRPDSPDFDFCDDGGRPKVVTYIAQSKYRPGDTVYIVAGSDNTPYLIATVPSVGKYTLCFTNGQPAMNGAEPLKGCVRDAREIAEHVNSSLVNVNTQLFTAENPPASSDVATQAESSATYSNVKSGLQEVLSVAEPGSYVYIHYSGHGVRMEATSEFSSRTTGDLALNVLKNASQNVTRPFPGLELEHILKSMVSKKLLVTLSRRNTLVLDCCFSGSVVRDATHNSSLSEERDMGIEDAEEYDEDENRDISMLPNWLVDPKGYTVITACGPHGVALELNLGGGTSEYRHGALSYFLLRAMKKLGGLGGQHAHIYPHLCSLFRQFRPTQNPMWYGNKELYFFGDATLSSELTGSPFAAHGIYEGDQFAVYTIASGRPLETECSSISMGGEVLVMDPSRVLDIVERLAKYRLVRDLANKPDDIPFQGLYRVSLINQAGGRFLPGTTINVRDGSRLLLKVENTGAIDLYIHIYNLGPLGQVKNIHWGSYSVIPPRNLAEEFTGELVKTFRPVISPALVQRGLASCEDTIKVFVTSKPTSFACLEVQSLEDFYDRGDVDPVVGYGLSMEQEDWVSCNFRVRTVKEPLVI